MSGHTPEPSEAHKLAHEYFEELDLALQNAHEAQRRDTLDAVGQRLRAALTGSGTVAGVRHAIRELGPVEEVARSSAQARNSPHPQGVWRLPLILAVISLAMSLWMPYVALPLAIGTLIAGVFHLRNHSSSTGWVTLALSAATILIVVALALLFIPAGDESYVDQWHRS